MFEEEGENYCFYCNGILHSPPNCCPEMIEEYNLDKSYEEDVNDYLWH